MLEKLPPRRDPRPLVLLTIKGRVSYTVLDAWEVRGVGYFSGRRAGSFGPSLGQLVLRVKPTALVLAGPVPPALTQSARRVARERGLPVLLLDIRAQRRLLRRAPTLAEITVLFPEVRGLAGVLARTVLPLAVAVLLTLRLPPRFYAKFPVSPASRMVA